MATTFQIVDTDLSTVLLDLNAGGNAFSLAHDPDLGAIDANAQFIDAGPAWSLASVDRGLVTVRFRVLAKQTTTDLLVTLARSLGTYLDKPCIYKVQLNNETTPRYFDAMRADIPGLIRGQEIGPHKIAVLLQDPDGIPVEVMRRPYFFGALVTESAAVVKNDPASGTNPKFRTVSVTGNMPTRAMVKIAPEAGASIVQARVGRRSYGDTAFRTSWYKQAEDGTLTSSASVADAAATGSDALDLFTAVETNFVKRWRDTFTGTTALEGTFRILGRLKVPASNTVRIQARWAHGNTTALIANEVVTITMPAGVSSQYATVDLGTCTVESGQGTTYGLSMEIWAAQDAGSSVVSLDWVGLWPIGPTPDGRSDQSLMLSTLGWRAGSTSTTSYRGTQLVKPTWDGTFTPGTDLQGVKILNDTAGTDAAGPPPTTGIVYPAGQVRVKALIRTIASTQDETLGQLVVRNITGSSTLTQVTSIGAHSTQATKTYSITFTANGTSAYLPTIIANGLGGNGNDEIRVQSMSVETIPTVGTGSELNSSGEYGHVRGRPSAYLTASGTHAGPLVQEGAFLDLYPGVNDLFYDWGEAPSAGVEKADPREPLALNTIDRNCTVTVSYYPRWSA